jgi:2-polyprenyl-6-hydroxyphenyl methylase/3-demethylubiquinone-9 3-methyltransferase
LKPGGQLVMTTPSGEYLKNSLPSFRELGDPKHWEHMQYTADGDGHFFAYTAEELREIAVAAGLQNVEVVWFESPWITGHMKVRYLHGRLPVRFLRWMDRLAIRLPGLGRRLSYQLMLKATKVI